MGPKQWKGVKAWLYAFALITALLFIAYPPTSLDAVVPNILISAFLAVLALVGTTVYESIKERRRRKDQS